MTPNPQAAAQYLRTKVMTATPEQLQMMLFDGALRFAEQAKIALQNKKFEDSFNLISKVQKILSELSCTLKHDVAPDLCKKLAGLYTYAYRELIDANINHNLEAIDRAIEVLQYQRKTWEMLLGQLGKQKAAVAATRLDMPAPDSRMEATISMQG
jgi:flagellar protein FliS